MPYIILLILIIIPLTSNSALLTPNYQVNHLPVNEDKQYEVIKTIKGEISAYNVGDIYNCDDTPCITASGMDACKWLGYNNNIGLVANNYYKFGTIIRLDNEIYKVVDRMNKRYNNIKYFDIAFPLDQKQEALEFGRKVNVEVEILREVYK